MKLRGNIHHDPRLTNNAHAATCAQRFQNRGHPCPRCNATAWPNPAQNMNRLTMQARCTVQNGSV